MTDDRDDPGAGGGFDESADDGLDLTPRTAPPVASPRRRRRRNPAAFALLAVVILGIGFVVVRGLGNATLYFRNADEALHQRDSLGERRFRLHGQVRDDVVDADGVVSFDVTWNGEDVHVEHRGDPPELFAVGRDVVLEGRFAEGSNTFESDRILVKHSEQYRADNPDRVGADQP